MTKRAHAGADTHAVMEAISHAIASMRTSLESDLRATVEQSVEAHRRRMWVRDTWCCADMAAFAKDTWLLPNPPQRDETTFGGVQLQLRGYHVNYCPFCGVMVK